MQPFAYLHRDGADHVEVLTGDVVTVPALADIPLPPGGRTLALIPYRQITERGFACVDDRAPLECLRVTGYETRPLDAFPAGPLHVRGGAFDRSRRSYEDNVIAFADLVATHPSAPVPSPGPRRQELRPQ